MLPYFKEHLQKVDCLLPESPLSIAISNTLRTVPAIFIKGFLLPMVETHCTLTEACTLATLLRQHGKLPVHPTANALMKLSEMPFSYPSLILISVLIQKRLALPNRAVDTMVVQFFVKSELPLQLPQLWYETLYTFVKR